MTEIMNEKINNKGMSSPFSSKDLFVGELKNKHEQVSSKIKLLTNCDNTKDRDNKLSEVIDDVKSMSSLEIRQLMKSDNEILRNLASRIFVDKSLSPLIDDLENMLEGDNENLKDSALTSLLYLNSLNLLTTLQKVAKDNSTWLKTRAIMGIADVAVQNQGQKAKSILVEFLEDNDEEVRKVVDEELSILL